MGRTDTAKRTERNWRQRKESKKIKRNKKKVSELKSTNLQRRKKKRWLAADSPRSRAYYKVSRILRKTIVLYSKPEGISRPFRAKLILLCIMIWHSSAYFARVFILSPPARASFFWPAASSLVATRDWSSRRQDFHPCRPHRLTNTRPLDCPWDVR